MAKDPAFLFYPGDYLRDTQCLSEGVQVAYDRIMCEHMRNICVSQQQLNFFTKKLSPGEKEELMSVLTKVDGGFQIDWVVESVTKRRAYSESRSKNRGGKKVKKDKEHMKTYVEHMENENEIENKEVNKKKKPKIKYAEGIMMTIDEFDKLCEEFGSEEATKAIDFLSAYKVEKEYKTKSDYLTIRRWVIKAVKERNNGKTNTTIPTTKPRNPGAANLFNEAAAEYGAIYGRNGESEV